MKYNSIYRFLLFSVTLLLSFSCTRNISKDIVGVNTEEIRSWLKQNGGNFSNETIVFQNKDQKSIAGKLDWSLVEKRGWKESEIIKVPFVFEGNSVSKTGKILNTNGFEEAPMMASIYIKRDHSGSIEALVKVSSYKDVDDIGKREKNVTIYSLQSTLVEEKMTSGTNVGYATITDDVSGTGTVNRSVEGQDCETIVSYRKKSSWSDCDGSHTGCYGHLTLTTIKESRTKCYASMGGNVEQIDWVEDDNFGGLLYEEYEEEELPPVVIEVLADTSITNHPRVKCIYDALMNANLEHGLAKILAKFMGETGYNVTFKVGETSNNNGYLGETGQINRDPFSKNIMITIRNTDAYAIDYPRIYLAKTFIHEAFHAQLIQYAVATFGAYVVETWPKPTNDATISELMDYISNASESNQSLANATHSWMANHIDELAISLREFVQYNYPDKYNDPNIGTGLEPYRAMMYMGLQGTKFYRENVGDSKDSLYTDYRVSLSLFTENCPGAN